MTSHLGLQINLRLVTLQFLWALSGAIDLNNCHVSQKILLYPDFQGHLSPLLSPYHLITSLYLPTNSASFLISLSSPLSSALLHIFRPLWTHHLWLKFRSRSWPTETLQFITVHTHFGPDLKVIEANYHALLCTHYQFSVLNVYNRPSSKYGDHKPEKPEISWACI